MANKYLLNSTKKETTKQKQTRIGFEKELVALRREIIPLLSALRKAHFTKEYVQKLLPYPLWEVDEATKTLTFDQAVRYRVKSNGAVEMKVLDQQKIDKRFLGLSKVDLQWRLNTPGEMVKFYIWETFRNDPYHRWLDAAVCLKRTKRETLPEEWKPLQKLCAALLAKTRAFVAWRKKNKCYSAAHLALYGGHPLTIDTAYAAGTLNWLHHRLPSRPWRLVGVNPEVSGKCVTIDLLRLLAQTPASNVLLKFFHWEHWCKAKGFSLSTWNSKIKTLGAYALAWDQPNAAGHRPYIKLLVPYKLLFSESLSTVKSYALEKSESPQTIIGKWRDAWKTDGLTDAGWRYFCHMSPAIRNRLCARCAEAIYSREFAKNMLIPALNLLAKEYVPITSWDMLDPFFVYNHHDNKGKYWSNQTYRTFIIASINEYKKRFKVYQQNKSCKTSRKIDKKEEAYTPLNELKSEISTIIDYLFHEEDATAPDPKKLAEAGLCWPTHSLEFEGVNLRPPKGVAYRWFFDRSKAWHKIMVSVDAARREIKHMAQANVLKAITWESLVEEVQQEDLIAVPLDSAWLLLEEGDIMGHCVHGYSPACRKENHRLFSIRDMDGARHATVELIPSPKGVFSVRQCLGAGNRHVSEKFHQFGRHLASLYTTKHQEFLRKSKQKSTD